MTANELAAVFDTYAEPHDWGKQAATMLRQQQAEIEELEKENTDLRYLIATKLEQQDGISLNSMAHPITNTPEPVAWAVWEGRPHDLFFTKEESDELCRLKGGDAKTVPLYTHPAKELTEKEIVEVINEHGWRGLTGYLLTFAHAILRKAQEK